MPPELTVHSLIPNPESLLALEPEELAGVVLEVLNALSDESTDGVEVYSGGFNRTTFAWYWNAMLYPPECQQDVSKALTEAWFWLQREGLIAPRTGPDSERYFVTRRGKQLKNREDFKSYRHGDLLPKKLLHPLTATKVWAAFLRGDYDTAVFQAFKEVEVAVRNAAHYQDTFVGVDLMRKAFHPETGQLTNKDLPPGERQALSDLFAGAIGSYKNPSSHRHVAIGPEEAVEMITLASHLLKIVDSRRPATT